MSCPQPQGMVSEQARMQGWALELLLGHVPLLQELKEMLVDALLVEKCEAFTGAKQVCV